MSLSPDIKKILFGYQRQALDDLAVLVPESQDLGAESFFEQFIEDGEAGFRDHGGCSGTAMIVLPGPKEAGYRAHLHIEQRYNTCSPHNLRFYRLEICWGFDIVPEVPDNDHLQGLIFTLRRGVRFDHHPRAHDPHHPEFHWHPNGCSEFRLRTDTMTPLKAAAVAFMMFDSERLSQLSAINDQLRNVVNKLRSEMPSLP